MNRIILNTLEQLIKDHGVDEVQYVFDFIKNYPNPVHTVNDSITVAAVVDRHIEYGQSKPVWGKVKLTRDLYNKIRSEKADGNKIMAIKLFREYTNAYLWAAKETIEQSVDFQR